jgi:hypothetical protein
MLIFPFNTVSRYIHYLPCNIPHPIISKYVLLPYEMRQTYSADMSRIINVLVNFQLGSLMTTRLPAGIDLSGQPVPLQLGISIRNVWGASTVFFFAVNVSNPDVSTTQQGTCQFCF